MSRPKRGAAALAEAAGTLAEAAADAAENEARLPPGSNGIHAIEYEDDPGDFDDDPPVRLGPLFKLPADKIARHARTRVYRDEPIDEGHVGDIGPDESEDAIRRKWGGGTFHAEAVDEKGGWITRRSGIKIAGEPRISSVLGRRLYKAWLASEFPPDEETPARAGASVSPIRNAEDQDALEEGRHKRELARIKAEADAYAQRAKADLDLTVARLREEGSAAVEKAKAEGQAAIDRVKAEAEEREKRDRAFYDAQQKQQAEFMVAIRGQEKAGDPLQQLKAMAGIISDLGGGNGGHAPDAVTALIENIPGIVGAVESATGGGSRASRPAAMTRAAPAAGGEESVTLTAALAKKAKLAAAHLTKQGAKDPAGTLGHQIERTLDRVLSSTGRVLEGGKGKTRRPSLALVPAKKTANKPAAKGSKK